MIICIGFDGTIVQHEFPDIGPPVPLALETMRRWQEEGHLLILWTVRSGEALVDAVKYLTKNGIKLHGVNTNPDLYQPLHHRIHPTSPKVHAQLYIDDNAFGCPLVYNPEGKNYVDWKALRPGYSRTLRKEL